MSLFLYDLVMVSLWSVLVIIWTVLVQLCSQIRGTSTYHIITNTLRRETQKNRLGGYLSRLMTKPTKWHVHPAKNQISLGIRPVWSESLLSTWRKLGSLATHWAHSEKSDQTGQMPRLIWDLPICGSFVSSPRQWVPTTYVFMEK